MSGKKRERTQRAILHAAKGLYEQYGVGNVPFDDIAKAAGVCRTTVFNHYADAGELQAALAIAEIGDLIAFCERSKLKGLALIEALLDQLIADTVNYPRVMARLTTQRFLAGTADAWPRSSASSPNTMKSSSVNSRTTRKSPRGCSRR